jgi:ABC-2 type transport system ATP-binding protein
MTTILTVNSLSKSYGSHKVLDKLCFKLQAGELPAVRGANGSGKTTLLHCISGLIPFDEGSITLAGQNTAGRSQTLRRNLVFIPDVPQFYTELTAYEHLHFIAAANNAWMVLPNGQKNS